MPSPKLTIMQRMFDQMLLPAMTQFSNDELDELFTMFKSAVARIKNSRNVIDGNAEDIGSQLAPPAESDPSAA